MYGGKSPPHPVGWTLKAKNVDFVKLVTWDSVVCVQKYDARVSNRWTVLEHGKELVKHRIWNNGRAE